jgi:hypothetical protein
MRQKLTGLLRISKKNHIRAPNAANRAPLGRQETCRDPFIPHKKSQQCTAIPVVSLSDLLVGNLCVGYKKTEK